MPKFRMLPLALALAVPLGLLALPAPAAAQFSDSYKFLESVKKKEGDKVTEMLAEGSPNLVNTRDVTTGTTALHIVTARRDLTWMEFLIGKGANVNARDFKGVTPLVSVGDRVSSGDVVATIEAMKMENVLFASADGVVGKVLAAKGESLSVDQPIIEFT